VPSGEQFPSLPLMSSRTFQWLLLLLLLLALSRHVWLATYVHPYADALSYATVGMRSGLMERLVLEYNHWNGRYFSNILVLRSPMVLGFERGLFWYRLVPLALMLLTWLGAYRLIRALFRGLLTNANARIAGLIFLLVYLNAMPDASEGFYWYTGAVSYQFPSALILILAAHWVNYLQEPSKPMPLIRSLFMGLLVVVIAGCSELHMAVLTAGHAVLLLVQRLRTGQWNKTVVLFFLLSVICALVVALAPGNAVRGDNFPMKHDLVHTGLWSTLQSGRFIAIWVLTTVLLPFSVLFIGWLRSAAVGASWFAMNKWLAAALPVSAVLLAMVLPYWSTGLLGQYRTVNTALLLFIPLWFVALAVWDAQVFRKRWPIQLDLRGTHCALLLVTLLFFVWGRDMSVSLDLFTGSAAQYDHEMLDRSARIEQAVENGNTELVLPPVTQPRSLVITQPGADPDQWMNRSLAEFFGNKDLELRVKPSR